MSLQFPFVSNQQINLPTDNITQFPLRINSVRNINHPSTAIQPGLPGLPGLPGNSLQNLQNLHNLQNVQNLQNFHDFQNFQNLQNFENTHPIPIFPLRSEQNPRNPLSNSVFPMPIQISNPVQIIPSQDLQNQALLVPVPNNINTLNNEIVFSRPPTPKFLNPSVLPPLNPMIPQISISPRQHIIHNINNSEGNNIFMQSNDYIPIQTQQFGINPTNQISSINDLTLIPSSQTILPNISNNAQNYSNTGQVTGELKNAGPQRVNTVSYQTPAGMATKTIIEEPFYIEQPPKVSTIYTLVNKPVIIQPPPENQLVEEVVNIPYTVQPPPQKQIVREIINKPVEIHQPPERQIIRETYQTPILFQPPPERVIINQKVKKRILVNQAPKTIIKRTEYVEPPVILEDNIEIPITNMSTASRFNHLPNQSGQVIYPNISVNPTNSIISTVPKEQLINTIQQEIHQINPIQVNHFSPRLLITENQFIPTSLQNVDANIRPTIFIQTPRNNYHPIPNNLNISNINYVNQIPRNWNNQDIINAESFSPQVFFQNNSPLRISNPIPNMVHPRFIESNNSNQATQNVAYQNISQLPNAHQQFFISNNNPNGVVINPVANMIQPIMEEPNNLNPILNHIPFQNIPQVHNIPPPLAISNHNSPVPLSYSIPHLHQPLITETNNMNGINSFSIQNIPPPLAISNKPSPNLVFNPVQNAMNPTFLDNNPVNQNINYQPIPQISTQNFEYGFTPQIKYQNDLNMNFSYQDNSSPLGYTVNKFNFENGGIMDIRTQI